MTQKEMLKRLEELHQLTTTTLQLSDPKLYQKYMKEINQLQKKLTK